MPNYTIRPAEQQDASAVLALYTSVLGSAFTTWSEDYPGEPEIIADLANGGLYVMTDGTRLVGAVSLAGENELDDLTCWSLPGRAAEFSRVCIAPDQQGKGLSRRLVLHAEQKAAESGCTVMHILAAKKNTPAVRAYLGMGYAIRGEVFMFGNDYYACEKQL